MATDTFDRVCEMNYGKLWSGQASCRVENEWVLPDYKEASQRLLRVDADPRITGKSVYVKGQEIVCEIEGEVYLEALYLPEGEGGEENVASFDATESFYHTFRTTLPAGETPDPEYITAICEGVCESVSARLLGPRRLSAKCDVALTLTLKNNREIPCFTEDLPADVEFKTEETETVVLAEKIDQTLELKEILTLPAAYLPIREMIDLHFSLFASHVKIENGAVDFTGHLTINASYAPDGEDGLVSFCQPIEFEKSIGADKAVQGDLCDIALTPVSIRSSVEMGESGENKDLALEVVYQAEISLFKRQRNRIVTDLFSVETDLDVTTEERVLSVPAAMRAFSREVVGEIPLKHPPFTRAENVRATLRFLDSFREGRKLFVRAEATLKYLALGESGEVSAFEDVMEMKFDLPDLPDLSEEDGNIELSGGVSDAVISLREDVIDVRLGVFGKAVVYRETKIVPVVSVERKDPLEKGKSGLLFYYPDEEESLWDVCKKCRARVSEVRGENKLEGEEMPPVLRIICR